MSSCRGSVLHFSPCSGRVLQLHPRNPVFDVLPLGRPRYWIDFTPPQCSAPLSSPSLAPVLPLSPSPPMVLSEFMVMVSNDVPSTLGYSGSLKDGGPPARPCLPSFCETARPLAPGRKKAVSRIHAAGCRGEWQCGERQKVKPQARVYPIPQFHVPRLAISLKEDAVEFLTRE